MQSSYYPRTLNRDEKINMIEQALFIEANKFQQHEFFNQLYSQDLIIFGIENNIPEAIRLGEYMLGEWPNLKFRDGKGG